MSQRNRVYQDLTKSIYFNIFLKNFILVEAEIEKNFGKLYKNKENLNLNTHQANLNIGNPASIKANLGFKALFGQEGK